MKRDVAVAVLLAALCGPVAPVAEAAERSWTVAVRGGGLSDTGSESGPDFATGFSLGASLGRRLAERWALRADFAFARAEGRGAGIGGSDFDRFAYDADLVFRVRRGSGLVPYLFGGGGVVTLSQRVKTRAGTFRSSFTKPHAKLGAGVAYETRGGVSVFGEAAGLLYSWDRYGFRDERQLDLTWSGGIGYGFGR